MRYCLKLLNCSVGLVGREKVATLTDFFPLRLMKQLLGDIVFLVVEDSEAIDELLTKGSDILVAGFDFLGKGIVTGASSDI